jgi:ABC-type transport system involved in multi-copper enzyme maturation permease subunit
VSGEVAAARRTFVRDVGLVARFEVAEAVRSRLLMVIVLLFVGGGAVAAWGYTEMVQRIEASAAQLTGAPPTRRPGGAFRRLRASRSYRDMIRAVTGSDAKADYYAALPPIVVFFGWVSFLFTPWLVLFTSAETVASEVGARTIRYASLRTGRLEFALGKLAGQALIVAGVTALSAVAAYVVAWLTLDDVEHAATALGMLSFWPRVLLYNLPFLAWALFASMMTASVNVARGLALGGGVGLAILGGMAANPRLRTGPVSEALWDLASYLTPFGHQEGLAYPPGGAFAIDLAVCLALAALYFAAGFAVLRRRDL